MNTEGKEEKPFVIRQLPPAHLPGGIKHTAMLEALKQMATLSNFYTSHIFRRYVKMMWKAHNWETIIRFWCCCLAFNQILREFRFLITSREVSVCGSESNPFYWDALKCQPRDLCVGAPQPSQKSSPGFGSAFPDGNSVICTHQSLQIDLNRSFLDAVIHYHQTLVLRKVHSSEIFQAQLRG